MRYLSLFLLWLIPTAGFSQIDLPAKYKEAEALMNNNQMAEAFEKFSELEEILPISDTLYLPTLWYTAGTAGFMEKYHRMNEEFEQAIPYGLAALKAIRLGKNFFDEQFAKREYWMVKNIIVSYFGQGNFEEGQKWKEVLYEAHQAGSLPEGLDEYFNFDYFTFEDKNIWGYEWFAELPEDRFGSSFTKVVYYVYSTDEEGEDKDQLYRLHVLMFHGVEQGFDYVMTKRLETATNEPSGTLYDYTYQEDIDFEKLHKDVKEILKGNLEPNAEANGRRRKKKRKKR
ncbi:hypothetical protein [Pontibacter sp. G13]|uniref:hypothetical protein n=1 Tax=Pontibacter sp. G13 TaxID=3074898 RepID=UPI002889D10A|nr:hypothetical protein [Pontibacter sp. G13]WNJ18295.1 hypothetical protein RJD25_25870 [Pontibacter sp. G13]